jgi:hypothetical protein
MTRNYGLTPKQTYNMFRDIRKRVFPEWGIPSWAITFSAQPFDKQGMPTGTGGLAATRFEMANPLKPATGIILDGSVLPWMHEDEVRGVLLHELAHVIAGWDADHDEPWMEVAEYLGSAPTPWILLREWQSIPEDVIDYDPDFIAALEGVPTYGW